MNDDVTRCFVSLFESLNEPIQRAVVESLVGVTRREDKDSTEI